MSYKGVLMLQAVYTMFGIHMHFSVIHVHIHRTTQCHRIPNSRKASIVLTTCNTVSVHAFQIESLELLSIELSENRNEIGGSDEGSYAYLVKAIPTQIQWTILESILHTDTRVSKCHTN